ncbi:hypothetical protein [Exercitatus varius]|uniref:hypothetical protein n=1 Tax=Exercitatus varius TaxID=67857 RepID=UPI00294AB9C0|nr:hypothetical protein [Exercitatus varius]MDG2961729.1 hypothetical protein [Exercitatus varius]
MNIINYLVRHKSEQYVIKAVVKKVSRSRLIRHIAFYIDIGGQLVNISRDIADVIEEEIENNGGGNAVVIRGCGTDMVFEILYRLFNRLGVQVPSCGIYSYQLL